jgi:hypothetical protein
MESLGKVHTKTLYRIQEAMMNYDFEIHYQKGSEMPADYLSRNLSSIHDLIPDGEVAQAQQGDPHLKAILAYLKHGTIPPDKAMRYLITRYAHRCFIDRGILWIRLFEQHIGSRALIMVPMALRQRIISMFHNSWFGGHEGIHKTIQRLQLYYFWPNMQQDVTDIIKACERCQKRHSTPHLQPSTLTPLPTLSAPNQRVHADLFGPLKTSSNGKKYILVMTDAFTRYVELIAVPNKEAPVIAEAIFNNWICRYGIPAQLVTDQGKEFIANVCQLLWKKLDLLHVTTSARHPQANAQAEVINKTIARYLASFVDESTLEWEQFLPPLMFSYNTAFHRSIKTSPFFLTYGTMPTMPTEITSPQYGSDLPSDIMMRLQIARNIARQHMDNATQEYKAQFDKHSTPKIFKKGDPVLLDEHSFLGKNTKLAPKYSGPHIVTRPINTTNVELLLDNGKSLVVHVNRLKRFLSTPFRRPDFVSQNQGGVEVTEVTRRGDKYPEQHTQHSQSEESQGEDNEGDEESDTDLQPAEQQDRRLTRSMARKQGLAYDDSLKQFRNINSSETVEAIRRKTKSKSIPRKRKVKYIPYIELEDNFEYEETITTKPEVKSEDEEEFDENELPSYMQDTPFPPRLQDLRRVLFEDTPKCYWLPLDDTPKSKLEDITIPSFYAGKPGLLKQALDGTATFLFGGLPKDEQQTRAESNPRSSSSDRDRTSRAGLMDETGRRRSNSTGPRTQEEYDTWDARGDLPTPRRRISHILPPSILKRTNRDVAINEGDAHSSERLPRDHTEGAQSRHPSKGAGSRTTESDEGYTRSDHPSSANEEETRTSTPRYSRMATRSRPDHLEQPHQLSEWFAKGEGYNEPATLRVLASRYLTDVAEIGHRLGGRPPDPAVLRELERRRKFLVKEFRRTGTRLPGFKTE